MEVKSILFILMLCGNPVKVLAHDAEGVIVSPDHFQLYEVPEEVANRIGTIFEDLDGGVVKEIPLDNLFPERDCTHA